MSLEAAISVLKRAVELDEGKSYSEALVCYQEGIGLLLQVVKSTTNEITKTRYKEQLNSYFERAENLKRTVKEQKEAGKYHEQIQIKDGSKGYSYSKIFGRYLDENVEEVTIEDPYIRGIHQIYNFLRLCELFVLHGSVRRINLITGLDDDPSTQQQRLKELTSDLKRHNIDLQVNYSHTLHDREIRFSNGWVIKIGRGLDFYKKPRGKFSIGYCNYNLRDCHETTIDIFLKRKQ
ncbi:MIT domain-containing protein 1 [Nematostella vectensis]|uniref:MIT domain-containing protein 1 n=1 Tax=Nematostella vectensis TaxID=45351 RepID=UPI0020777837|nr:MIT domain-containing protein 1 [Nematostella vectensis]